jgi:hypothetical protein
MFTITERQLCLLPDRKDDKFVERCTICPWSTTHRMKYRVRALGRAHDNVHLS